MKAIDSKSFLNKYKELNKILKEMVNEVCYIKTINKSDIYWLSDLHIDINTDGVHMDYSVLRKDDNEYAGNVTVFISYDDIDEYVLGKDEYNKIEGND